MEKKAKSDVDTLTAEELSSIEDSHWLTSEEKSSLLASYWTDEHDDDICIPRREISTCSSSSGVDEKVQDTEAKAKGDPDSVPSDGGMLERNDEYVSQQGKKKGALHPLTPMEISSILDSNLSLDDKSSLLANLSEDDIPPSDNNTCSTPSRIKLEENIRDTEAKAKGDHDSVPSDDGMLERNDESLSFPSSQQVSQQFIGFGLFKNLTKRVVFDLLFLYNAMEEKTKEAHCPLTAMEISSILDSNLTSEEKSALLDSNLSEDDIPPSDDINGCSTSLRINLEVQRKTSTSGVVLGEDVLTMVVEPHIDHSLIMGLVVVFGLIHHKL